MIQGESKGLSGKGPPLFTQQEGKLEEKVLVNQIPRKLWRGPPPAAEGNRGDWVGSGVGMWRVQGSIVGAREKWKGSGMCR